MHRAQRSQIRLQIRSFLTVQIDPVGAKLQMTQMSFIIRDLMTPDAILFYSSDDLFTPGGVGLFAFRTRHEVPSKNKSILYNLGAHGYLSCGTCDE